MGNLIKSISANRFVSRTIFYSLLMAFLFLWKGHIEGYKTATFVIIGYALTYSVIIAVFKEKIFLVTQVAYSLILMYLQVFYDVEFGSNFTAFFCIVMAILFRKKYENVILLIYLAATIIVFVYLDEKIYDAILHYTRCLWILETVYTYHKNIYGKRILPPLVLTDSQRYILSEICKGKYQKEIDGYSENTVSEKLKEAALTNNCSKEELKVRFSSQFL